jgi:hypothetical protein
MEIEVKIKDKAIERELRARGFTHSELKKCLPFFKSNRGEFIHRVRAGRIHFRHGVASHTSIDFFCGNSGFLHKGELLADAEITCKSCQRAFASQSAWHNKTSKPNGNTVTTKRLPLAERQSGLGGRRMSGRRDWLLTQRKIHQQTNRKHTHENKKQLPFRAVLQGWEMESRHAMLDANPEIVSFARSSEVDGFTVWKGSHHL